MKRHIFLALLPTLFAVFMARTATASVYDMFYANPFTVEPDSTKVVFPIPVSTGKPLDDLNNQSPLYLNDPDNFSTEIIYDPLTGQYTFKRRVGQFYYDTPTTLSQSEYLDYQNRKGIQEYWKERRSQNARSTTNGSSIIPPMFVGGKAFETIFGSNTVEIRPQGSVDLTFGFKHSFRDDKSRSERSKRHNDFVFDQDIQLNVMAKIGDKINFNINNNTKATFGYQNKLALKYEGKEDEIIQLLEAGNVSFPLNSTLIQGTQQLFGIKSKLKFGNTTVSSIVSYQESESQTSPCKAELRPTNSNSAAWTTKKTDISSSVSISATITRKPFPPCPPSLRASTSPKSRCGSPTPTPQRKTRVTSLP